MVKFGKNKFKALNKIAKSQKIAATSPGVSNKILKKKINAEKRVTFQKEVLLKETVAAGDNALVKNVTASKILNSSKTPEKKKAKEQEDIPKPPKPKKPVEKRKKRQKTQINDTKLMLRLMKKQNHK